MALDPTVFAGLLGGIGGLTRGVVGLLKAMSLRRRVLWVIMQLLWLWQLL